MKKLLLVVLMAQLSVQAFATEPSCPTSTSVITCYPTNSVTHKQNATFIYSQDCISSNNCKISCSQGYLSSVSWNDPSCTSKNQQAPNNISFNSQNSTWTVYVNQPTGDNSSNECATTNTSTDTCTLSS